MKRLASLLPVFAISAFGYCQDPASATDRSVIVSNYESEIETLTRAYEQKTSELDAAYIAKIKKLRKDATAKLEELQKEIASDDLDEAIHIRDTVKKLRASKLTPPGKIASGANTKLNELEAKNRELQKQLSIIEKLVGYQSQLTKQVIGRTYRITFGGKPRTWTFGPNGVLIVNGNPSPTRWIAFGNDGIVCAGTDNGNVDLCQFSDAGATIEVVYVGDFKKSRTRHSGKLVNQ